MKPIKHTNRIIFKGILLAIGMYFYCACTPNKNETHSDKLDKRGDKESKTSVIPPVTVLITNPIIVNLDTCPRPQVITVPQKLGGTYVKKTDGLEEIINLLPPETKPINFISLMQNYTTDNGLALDAIFCSIMDKKGNLWFGTLGGGASRYDGKSFTNFTTAQGLVNNIILSITEDKTGNIWFGTYGGGVSRYDGKSFINFTAAQGLADNTVWSIKEDRMGNLWFGTQGGGVSRYDGNRIDSIERGKKIPQQDLKREKGKLIKSFTNFTAENGLANNAVSSIVEDKIGNIWFGTLGGGVSRYDGNRVDAIERGRKISKQDQKDLKKENGKLIKSFTNYTTEQGLTNNVVRSIMEDKKGNIWITTNGGGVSRHNPSSGGFINFTTEQGLTNNVVRSIIEDKKGNIWFGTDGGGVSCYNPSSDSYRTGLRADSESFTNFTTEQGLANNVVRTIVEDKTGNIWFGTFGGGLSRYDGKSFINSSTAQGIANNLIVSIAEDKKGNLWFGTNGSGASCYDPSPDSNRDSRSVGSKLQTNFTTAQGLANDIVVSVLADKNGNIWLGTRGGGVSYYDGKSFTNFTTAQGLVDNTVWSIKEDKNGIIWFGTDGGVSRYDPSPDGYRDSLSTGSKSFTNFTTAQGLTDNVVRCILEDKKGNLWFGTNAGGVSRYDGNLIDAIERGEKISQLGKQNLKRQNGKFVKSFTNFTTAQGLGNNIVLSMVEDKMGNIWLGTSGGGVSRYDGKSFANFTTTQGLANNVVTQIVITKEQNIILGTNFGLSLITGFSLSTENKLNGRSVISSQNKLTNEELKNYAPVFEIYNAATGYAVKDVNEGQNGIFKDRKGILWIASGADKTGLVQFDYAALNKNSTPPLVFIQSIKINEENICWNNLLPSDDYGNQSVSSKTKNKLQEKDKKDSTSTLPNITEEVTTLGRILSDAERNTMRQKFGNIKFNGITKFYPLPENLILEHNLNNITFDFAAIEPAKPYLIQYQYILEGYNNDWSPITNKTSANFGNIYEGKYTFKVRAKFNGIAERGVEGWSEPISYTFEVLPPWYRTWWAYVLYAITCSFLLFGFLNWRTASLLKIQEKLENTVQKRTEEVQSQKYLVEEINKELKKLSIVARETANGVFITNANGDIEWFNEGFSKLFGWKSIEEYKKERGATIFDVSENENINFLIKEAIHQKKSITYENATLTKDKAQLWIQTTLTPIFDEQGQLDKLVFVETNITELKNSEAQFMEVNKELEAFSYSVSHDLRAPLRAINSYSKILEEDYISNLDLAGATALNAILKNSKIMKELIDDLLAFSKLGRAEINTSEINMVTLVQSIIEEEMTHNPNEIEFKINELIPSNGAQALIKQVWVNLISNAVKYSKNNPKPHIEIGSYRKENFIVYYVKDNGAGFDMQHYEKLFGVFQRLHSHEEFEGTGIGLAIVQKVIQRHKGTVWAESKLNEGSCFYFSLPE